MMDDLDPELSRLFDAARGVTDPTREDRTRIRSALAAKLATGVLLTSASAKAAAGAGANLGGVLGKSLKLVLLKQIGPGLLVGSLLGGGASLVAAVASGPSTAPPDTGVSQARSTAHSRPSNASLPPVTTVSSAGALPRAEPLPSPRSSMRPEPADQPPPANDRFHGPEPAIAAFPEPKPQPPASELSGELAVVSRMQSAWQRSDWAGVRSAIRDHEQRFPRGTLSEEREAVKVMLACRSTEPARAIELGASFSSRHPNSTHAARVSAVCGGNKR
jgi:hypothetical protein